MKRELQTLIEEAEDDLHLLPIICEVPLEIIKNFLIKTIQHHQQNKINIKGIYLKMILPINKILPKDIIQYILSFMALDLEFIKLVNKQWKKLSEINEAKCYSNLLPNEKSNKYIMRYPRIQLTSVEKRMGLQMIPYYYYKKKHNIDITNITRKNNGNEIRIIVYPGNYSTQKSVIFNANVSIIGVQGDTNDHNNKPPSIYFDVPFSERRYSSTGTINIVNGCKLHIERCQILSSGCTINVDKDSSLFIKNSILSASCYGTAIRITDDAKMINVTNTILKSSKHCIKLVTKATKAHVIKQFICQNNTFTNIESYAIIKKRMKDDYHHHDCEHEANDFKLEQDYDKNIFKINNNKWNYQYEWKPAIQHKYNEIYVQK